jgi:RND family efflux transporter MFP subunit
MKDYRTAFITTLTIALALAAALAYIGWRHRWLRGAAAESSAPEAGGPTLNPPPSSTPLAALQISPQRLQRIGVKIGTVQLKTVSNQIRAVGNVAVDERLQSYVQLRFSGWIQKVFADTTYQYIRQGQPLLTIYSPELVTTEQEYLLALKDRRLLAASVVPGVASGANSLLNSAAARLNQWEIPAREIQRLKATGRVRRQLQIDSPVSGFITERNALPNLYVRPDTRLYAVANLSTVWVIAEVFQPDMGQIKAGDPATVTTDAYPGRAFRGRVDFIYPEVDMTTRTVKVRLAFSNPRLTLAPGMFVNVTMQVPLGRHLVIPASGVFQTGTHNIVFIDRGGGYLEPRDVELGPQAGDEFIVLKGLKPGERIVTSANFLIDSESQLQAAIGSFMPPPPGAGAAAAMNAPRAQASIEFTTRPSPPHKGDNTFRVRLTSANGRPVTGAQVTVTFFMPAMPAMGMSAMRTVVTLADQGGGVYAGRGNLTTGGTWQVTITAQKDGRTIAAQQFTVSTEGGM